jgi:small-conductance mechanosensitive channel
MRATLVSAVGVFALAAIVGCNESGTTTKTHMSASDNRTVMSTTKEMEVTNKTADDKTMALKEELRKSTKAQLDATDAAIATLQAHEKTATGDAKKDIDKEIDSLKSKRDELQKHYDKIETTGPSSWDQFKNDVSKAADDLSAATKRALDGIKK